MDPTRCTLITPIFFYFFFILAGSTARRKLDLFRPKEEFLELVKNWDMYDEGSMGITIAHLTRFETFDF